MTFWRRCRLETADKGHRLEIDLIIKSGKVAYGRAYFGVWRDTGDEKQVWPLMFLADESAVDYGSDFGDGKARYGSMALHGQTMHVDAGFTYSDRTGTYELKAAECCDLTD